MVRILNGIWNLEAQPFEIQTNGCHFVKHHLKSRQKCPDFEWSSFWIVGTKAATIAKARPFENWTIWNLTFKKSGFQIFPGFKFFQILNRQISDPHCVLCINCSVCLRLVYQAMLFWLKYFWPSCEKRLKKLCKVFVFQQCKSNLFSIDLVIIINWYGQLYLKRQEHLNCAW